MRLYFYTSYGEKQLIASPETVDDAVKEINKFLEGHMYRSYYTRKTEDEHGIIFDVGSHTEFFYLDYNDFDNIVDRTKGSNV